MIIDGPTYDGSANAHTAIDAAARRFPGATAVVLDARQPLGSLAAHLEGHPAVETLRDLDAATLDAPNASPPRAPRSPKRLASSLNPESPPRWRRRPRRSCRPPSRPTRA